LATTPNKNCQVTVDFADGGDRRPLVIPIHRVQAILGILTLFVLYKSPFENRKVTPHLTLLMTHERRPDRQILRKGRVLRAAIVKRAYKFKHRSLPPDFTQDIAMALLISMRRKAFGIDPSIGRRRLLGGMIDRDSFCRISRRSAAAAFRGMSRRGFCANDDGL
jgi:hypothetical protein